MELFHLLCKLFAAQLLVSLCYYRYLYFQEIFSLVKLYFLILVLTNLLLIYWPQLQIASSNHPFFLPPNHHLNHLKNFQIISFFAQSVIVFLPSSLLCKLDVLHEITLLNFCYLIQQHLMVWLLRNLWWFWG